MSSLLYLLIFFAGVVLPAFLPVLPTLYQYAVLLVCACLCIGSRYIFRGCSQACLSLGFGLLGFIASCGHLQWIIDKQLEVRYEGSDISANVKIITNPVSSSTGRIRFDGRIIDVLDGGGSDSLPSTLIDSRVRLSSLTDGFASTPKEGDVWKMVLRLKRPRGLVNPGGFDYQAWLLYHRYVATGYVKRGATMLLVEREPLSYIRQLGRSLEIRLFSGDELALRGFFRALLLGDRSRLTQDHWSVLTSTGTSHLMAISGLHIGLVAFFAFMVGRFLLALCCVDNASLLRFFPCISGIFFSGVYAALSGFAIPAQRAWMIVTVVSVLFLWGRTLSSLHLLLLVAIFVVLMNPMASTQHSFYLSFIAVFILLYAFSRRTQKIGVLKATVLSQWVVFCGLFMILVIRQLPISLVSPLANLLAVPVVSFVVIPLLFVSALLSFVHQGLAMALFQFNHYIFSLLWSALEIMGSWHAPLIISPPSPLISIVMASIALLCLLAPRSLCLRGWGVACVLLFCFPRRMISADIDMTILDVGQGLSVVTETTHHNIVYDVGAKFSERFDIGSRIVAPFLRYRDIAAIDLLILSHGDNDHAGGLAGLAESLTINELAANHADGLLVEHEEQGACVTGRSWTFDGVDFDVLWPRPDMMAMQSENNRSCVVLMRYGSFTALFSGDIEKRVEQHLLDRGVLPEDIDVLIAPHHGSNTSSSQAFVAHLRPKLVIFSAGYKNAYGHPTETVKQRYLDVGAEIFNTSESGAVRIRIDTLGKPHISEMRIAQRTPWYL